MFVLALARNFSAVYIRLSYAMVLVNGNGDMFVIAGSPES